MTITVTFFTDELEGDSATLFNLLPTGPVPVTGLPVESVPISNGVAAFASSVSPFLAFTVASGGRTVHHSTFGEAGANEVDAAGNFSRSLFYLRLAPIVVPPAGVAALAPSTPIVGDEAMVFPPVSIVAVGNSLQASGAAMHLSTGRTVNFLYVFDLAPVLALGNTGRLLGVETVSSIVVSAAGGPAGFIVDAVVNLILGFLRDSVAAGIEEAVQDAVDDGITVQIGSAAPAGTTARVRSVSVDAVTGLTLDVVASLPAGGVCASIPSFGSVRMRRRTQLDRLRRIRDQVLAGTPQGDAYVRTLARHSPELVRMLIADRSLLKASDALVRAALTEFKGNQLGDVRISAALGRQVRAFLGQIAEGASEPLAGVARALCDDVRSFVGKPVRRVLERSRPVPPRIRRGKRD